jgi:hypothetical protein
MTKPDKAAKIAADWHRDNPALAALLAIKIREAVNEETQRCVGIATSVHADYMSGSRGEGAWACEEIIARINPKPTPKPKRKARK